LGVIVFVGLVGGSYPAFYLSKFNPVGVLKGSLSKGSGNIVLRRVLVVVQFSIAMIMLICTMVVYNQLQYLQKVDLGFNQQQVVSLTANANYDIRSKIRAFVGDLGKNPSIVATSTSQSVPGLGSSFNLLSMET